MIVALVMATSRPAGGIGAVYGERLPFCTAAGWFWAGNAEATVSSIAMVVTARIVLLSGIRCMGDLDVGGHPFSIRGCSDSWLLLGVRDLQTAISRGAAEHAENCKGMGTGRPLGQSASHPK
jgi:hypothetical protein